MKIEYGYDRSVRSWNIVVLDSEGNIVASSYVGDIKGCKYEIEIFKKEYNIKEVIKIKAY